MILKISISGVKNIIIIDIEFPAKITPLNASIAKQNRFLLLKLTTYRGAVLEQGAVYKTWFFKRPG